MRRRPPQNTSSISVQSERCSRPDGALVSPDGVSVSGISRQQVCLGPPAYSKRGSHWAQACLLDPRSLGRDASSQHRRRLCPAPAALAICRRLDGGGLPVACAACCDLFQGLAWCRSAHCRVAFTIVAAVALLWPPPPRRLRRFDLEGRVRSPHAPCLERCLIAARLWRRIPPRHC